MKKIFNKILSASCIAVALVGCTDLDTEPMGSTVTSDQKTEVVASNPEMVEASVTAISSMASVYMNTTGGHDDFGYGGVMLTLDTKGQDLVSKPIGYNWFAGSLVWSDVTFTSDATYMIWSTMYNQIKAANDVAKLISPDTQDSKLQYYLAQALVTRAFDYFTLAQVYQFNYVGNEDKPCVPIITDTNADEVASNGCPRSTVRATYDLILSDINKAVELLEATDEVRKDKRYADVNVARALRARIHLTMQNWSEAEADAQYVIDNSGATPYSIADLQRPRFIDITDNSWLWGILINETDRVVTSGIVNFPSHMGSLNYGYASVGAWKSCNKALYKSIPATDIRKNWFIDENLLSPSLTAEEQEYILRCNKGEDPIPPYTQVKFAAYNNEVYTSTNACDIPLIRIEEMYYILAEAQAMGGDPAKGASTLNSFVQTYRNPSYSFAGGSETAVQDEIWHQRRIEFIGEGISWFDIKRLGKGIDRRGGGYDMTTVFNITGNDDLMNYLIPQAEIEGNPLLTEADNNPTVTAPTPVPDVE